MSSNWKRLFFVFINYMIIFPLFPHSIHIYIQNLYLKLKYIFQCIDLSKCNWTPWKSNASHDMYYMVSANTLVSIRCSIHLMYFRFGFSVNPYFYWFAMLLHFPFKSLMYITNRDVHIPSREREKIENQWKNMKNSVILCEFNWKFKPCNSTA